MKPELNNKGAWLHLGVAAAFTLDLAKVRLPQVITRSRSQRERMNALRSLIVFLESIQGSDVALRRLGYLIYSCAISIQTRVDGRRSKIRHIEDSISHCAAPFERLGSYLETLRKNWDEDVAPYPLSSEEQELELRYRFTDYTGGVPSVGELYDAFAAAWTADNYVTARSIARMAKQALNKRLRDR